MWVTYQLLKYGLQTYYAEESGYLRLAMTQEGHTGKLDKVVKKFNDSVVRPFINYIEAYLSGLHTDLGEIESLTLEQTRVYQDAKAEGRKEREAEMLLEQTRVYQDAKAEGRAEREAEILKSTVPLLLKTGMSVEQIAQQLNVDVESVLFAAQENTDK